MTKLVHFVGSIGLDGARGYVRGTDRMCKSRMLCGQVRTTGDWQRP